MRRKPSSITSLQFFSKLVWLDGKPLHIEPYRRRLSRPRWIRSARMAGPFSIGCWPVAERRTGSQRIWSWPGCIALSCGAQFRAEILSYWLPTRAKLLTIWTC